ncbi:hypothetical protein N9X65_07375, partial [Porticoccaceae bacterium]|nr:hypothetical protein [Porticoccaceae bacterium]
GNQLKKYADTFEMVMNFHDVNSSRSEVPLETILTSSDIIILSASYLPEINKYPILGAREMLLLDRPCTLINTSRGEVVDEYAVLDLLNENTSFRYFTDVLRDEHNLKTSKLFVAAEKLENLAITPHVSGATYDSMRATEDFCAEKFAIRIKSDQQGI